MPLRGKFIKVVFCNQEVTMPVCRVIEIMIVGLICVGSLASCVGLEYQAHVDSFAHPDLKTNLRYILLPGEKDMDPSDLQFLEFASYVEKVLAEKGYNKAQSADKADIAIFLSYGIGDPQTHQASYAMPTYGQTGVSSATTYGTISSFGGTGSYSGATTYTPTYGVTGYVPMVQSYTTYRRFLLIAGYELLASAKYSKSVQLWKTEVLSSGSSNDLRKVFPYMVAAMRPYLATNTGRKIQVNLSEDDEFANQLKSMAVPEN
jgi:hypothetical protein